VHLQATNFSKTPLEFSVARNKQPENCALLGCYAANGDNCYRRVGTVYWSHLQGPRNVSKKLPILAA